MVNIKNLNHLAISIFLILLLAGCSNKKDNYESIIVGKEGNYWDIIYIENKYRKIPSMGYFFNSKGEYYAYHYYDEGKRTPFDEYLFDKESPKSVKENTKKWYLLSDTGIVLSERTYKIEYIKEDTISLITNVEDNPIIKLVKVKM